MTVAGLCGINIEPCYDDIVRSDVAINVSIGIMRAFVEMRKFLATNSLILNRIDDLEVKQLDPGMVADLLNRLRTV